MTLATTEDYARLGFKTVPLSGSLARKKDGTKTTPTFEPDWKSKYTATTNTNYTPLSGALTGKDSGIIAIDCDSAPMWALFRSMDPDYPFVFESEGKAGGTIVYKYTDELPDTFKSDLKLDFFSSNGFVYLPTPANKTKKPLTVDTLAKLGNIPQESISFLKQFQPKASSPAVRLEVKRPLTPLLKEWLASGKTMCSKTLKIVTPHSFRDSAEYKDRGFCHPANVAKGRGSEYLSKVSAILGADASVDHELYVSVLTKINELMKDPMDYDRFISTIVDPMLEGRASIDGTAIWAYDENWDAKCEVLATKENRMLTIVYEPNKRQHLVIDELAQEVQSFARPRELVTHLKNVGASIDLSAVESQASLVDRKLMFDEPWGLISSGGSRDLFNPFKRSKYMEIIQGSDYAECPPVHAAVLDQIKNKEERDYLVSFMATKLKTFKYSPVSFLFYSATNGTGKNIIIERIFGALFGTMYGDVSISDLQDKYNSYATNYLFASSDELGELTYKEANKIYGKVKAITGKESISIRAMHQDPETFNHSLTFAFTTNDRAFPFDETDRRFYVVSMKEEQLDYVPTVPKENLYELLDAEREDFARYLAGLPLMDEVKYRKAPKTEGKEQKQSDFDSYEKSVVRSVAGTRAQFEQFLLDNELEETEIANHILSAKQVCLESLVLLMEELSLVNGGRPLEKKNLVRSMNDLGISKGKRAKRTILGTPRNTYPLLLNNSALTFA